MKYVHFIVSIILCNFSFAGEDISLMVEVKTQTEESLSTRLDNLLTDANALIFKFETTKGSNLLYKFKNKWKDKTENRDENQVADEMLVSKFKEIRDLKKEKKEIRIDLVYEACLIFKKYETSDNKLPLCIVAILKDSSLCEGLRSIVVDARKQLENPLIAGQGATTKED